jgi:hypothetical protein
MSSCRGTDPKMGIVSFRIADETGVTQRRHVPRLRAGDPMLGSDVTTFLGVGHALSRTMLAQVGGWPEPFFFAHEETDMAWRALDAGWRVVYEPQLLLQHPRTSPARHAFFYRMTARNRVYLARRHVPCGCYTPPEGLSLVNWPLPRPGHHSSTVGSTPPRVATTLRAGCTTRRYVWCRLGRTGSVLPRVLPRSLLNTPCP